MKLDTQVINSFFKISIDGDVDANSSILLDETITKALENDFYNLLIDCKNLKYISSAGLGVFISYIDDLSFNNGGFSFYNMRENVFDVFKLLGLNNLVNISSDENEATEYLQQKLNSKNA